MKLIVEGVMTKSVASIRADANIDEAFALMLRHHIGGLPVVNDDNVLVGVISELDLLQLLNDTTPEKNLVRDYASSNVVSVRPNDSLPDIVEMFLDQRLRRTPVVDDQNRLIGVLSRRDLIRFIRETRLRMASVLQHRREAEALPS